MAVYLITGKPGSFKSAFAMQKALDYIKDGRLVYFCNFRGLQAEKYNLNVLEHPKLWAEHEYQQGSVFFIDEIQEFTREVPTNAKTEDLPKWFTLLEKHRHLGYDFYVITQHPMFIHTHIRRLLEKHYHMQRAVGLPFSNCREWQQVCNEPENIQNATIKAGCTVTVYKPNKKVFDYYESTKLDTHKLQIPKKLFTYIFLIICAIILIAYLASGFVSKYFMTNDNKTSIDTKTQTTSESKKDEFSVYDAPVILSADKIKLEEEILKLKDELNHLKEQQQQSQIIEYNPDEPFKKVEYQYQANTQPYLSGCIQYEKHCDCFTQQGSRLKVSYADCQKIINDGLPFNPFLDNRAEYNYSDKYTRDYTQSQNSQNQNDVGNKIVGETNNDTFFDKEDNKMSYLTRE